ncbi:Rossmann-fold NAD(P)-binding domain-containing protein [Riemerella anatipestifer]|uniref:epimerase n=1 Tax=Riemerella anatipestifer TaxID=34085 RepID=UPI001AD78312|nr:epimerase [Riemerella anatipestifer]MBO4233599.1 epimerase [Riemerella anatipestifer]MCO4304461.1 epimerase [Riemerella anatipestifer]MCO7353234.1 epimerase [Riemerella anatipestifer]MCQ4039828.1 epimerase [Riemerella anatipestifer]MCT6761506.1 epimerase [Riemerella anatipestifer]
MKHLGIIGCGWLGKHLVEHFAPAYSIHTTNTSESKTNLLKIKGYQTNIVNFDNPIDAPWEILSKLDAIIITVPFSKRTDLNLLKTRFHNISRFIFGFENPIFLMSSIGIYPQIEGIINENTLNEADLDQHILSIEKQMKSNFPHLNILRLGGLMGGNRMLSNYKVNNLHQVVNHIHYKDVCLVIEKMLNRNLTSKIYNIVAPLHPTKLEILNQQIGKAVPTTPQETFGRIISSRLSEIEIPYNYRYPDPTKFV